MISWRSLGKTWGLRAVLFAAVVLYAGMALLDPGAFQRAVIQSLKEVEKLMLPLTAAIFVGAAVKNLLTPQRVSKWFGKGEGGGRGAVNAGIVGSVLPSCPFVSYPVIRGFTDGGVKFLPLITMLVATTTVEVGQLFCGLAVFGAYVVGVRILFAFAGVAAIGLFFHFFYTRFVG